jgi:hypothetical protein
MQLPVKMQNALDPYRPGSLREIREYVRRNGGRWSILCRAPLKNHEPAIFSVEPAKVAAPNSRNADCH